MAVTLNTTLPKIAFSKNPLWIELESDDYLDTPGVKSVATLNFNVIPVDTEIPLTWGEIELVFVAKLAPDDSGLQFPSGDGSEAYVSSLVEWFEGNDTLSADFEVSTDFSNPAWPALKFTARKSGSRYNLSSELDDAFLFTLATPGVNEVAKASFTHSLEVWFKNFASSKIYRIYSAGLFLDPGTGAKSTQPINEILNSGIAESHLDYDIPSLEGYWFSCTNSIGSYYLRYAQAYGEPSATRKHSKTAVKHVALGGFSNLALSNISGNDHLEKMLLPDAALYQFQRWFENWPIDQFEVKTNQPQYLYFINNRDVAETLSLKVVVTYDDTTSDTITKAGSLVQSFEKICVGCGYQQLGLDALTTDLKKVSSYTIQIMAGAEERSLIKSFTVNRNYENYTRYFLYSDGAGNFKTLRTWGESSGTSEITRDLFKKQTDARLIPTEGEFAQVEITSIYNDEVNSGYITSKDAYDSVMEFMHAEKAFRVVGSNLIPIVITSKKFGHAADGQNLNAVKIEYQVAFEERTYTGDSYALNVPKLNRSQSAINDL